MGKAIFKVECEEMGLSRSWEIPIHGRGYVRELVENLEKAMEFYELRAENHKLKQERDGWTKKEENS